MIFVTVGTHEQQFDRLLKEVDRLKGEGKIIEDVIIQTGFSTYVPQYCKFNKFYSYVEMEKLMDTATKVITHGGPASFMNALSKGKMPIVVPRLVEFKEHVNNHQLDFIEKVINQNYPIILLENINELEEALGKDSYYTDGEIKSNNLKFNEKLSQIVLEMMEVKK